MDQEKFDALVQKLAGESSRRGVVRGAVTGAVGSALAAVGIQSADAKQGDGGKKDKDKGAKKGGGKKDKDGKKGKDGGGNGGGGAGKGPEAERCIPDGRRCGKGKTNNGRDLQPCRKCCSRNSVQGGNGNRRCACKPDGDDCGNDAQCCSGVCDGGACGPLS